MQLFEIDFLRPDFLERFFLQLAACVHRFCVNCECESKIAAEESQACRTESETSDLTTTSKGKAQGFLAAPIFEAARSA